MSDIPLLAPVALLVDLPELGLTRGQMGTVVERRASPGDSAILVEFADEQGQTRAIVDLRADQVVVLHYGSRAA